MARLASVLCDTPYAAISFVAADRQWFKAEVGLGLRETGRDVSICAHAILHDGLFEIPDTRLDPRLRGNRIVEDTPGVRFYAAAPLRTLEGRPIGTLCVMDLQPRRLTDVQRLALRTLANQVMAQLELRRLLAAQHESEARALARERVQRFLLELEDTLRTLDEPGPVMDAVAMRLGRHLGAQRCAYAVVEPDQDHLAIAGDDADRVPGLPSRVRLPMLGEGVLAVLRAGSVLAIEGRRHGPAGAGGRPRRAARAVGGRRGLRAALPGRPAGRADRGRAARPAMLVRRGPRARRRCRRALPRDARAPAGRAAGRARAPARRARARGGPDGRLGDRPPERRAPLGRRHGRDLRARPRRADPVGAALRVPAAGRGPRDGRGGHRAAARAGRRDGDRVPDPSRRHRRDALGDDPGARLQDDPRVLAGVSVDSTSRKLAEERLLEADARKDEFLAMLAHELRNPLAPLANALHVLGRRGSMDSTDRRMLEMAERQLRQLRRLVDDLLEVGRITRARSSCGTSRWTWPPRRGPRPSRSASRSRCGASGSRWCCRPRRWPSSPTRCGSPRCSRTC